VGLFDNPSRTSSEDEVIIHTAHASCYHWLVVGTGLDHQRAEWLLARVYTVRGMAEQTLLHARRCLELTQENAGVTEDFDRAYAYEGMARASALAQNHEDALEYLHLAKEAGNVIKNEENKKIFLSNFNAGIWYDLK
jgi:hypothetical protein